MARYFKWNDGTLDEHSKSKVRAIQKGLGAYEDGLLGDFSLDSLYRRFAEIKYPYAEKFFDAYVVYTTPERLHFKDVKNTKSVNNYPFSASGTFQWANKVTSILVDGEVIGETSAHAWRGFPESVLYFDGEVKYGRYTNAPNCKWAIGGLGLTNYDPSAEGFSGKYSDVLRKTHHAGIGVTQEGQICYFLKTNCTIAEFKKLATEYLKLKYAINLDGGHIPALNAKYKFNRYQKQSNIILF
jgi:hypothetical protein